VLTKSSVGGWLFIVDLAVARVTTQNPEYLTTVLFNVFHITHLKFTYRADVIAFPKLSLYFLLLTSRSSPSTESALRKHWQHKILKNSTPFQILFFTFFEDGNLEKFHPNFENTKSWIIQPRFVQCVLYLISKLAVQCRCYHHSDVIASIPKTISYPVDSAILLSCNRAGPDHHVHFNQWSGLLVCSFPKRV